MYTHVPLNPPLITIPQNLPHPHPSCKSVAIWFAGLVLYILYLRHNTWYVCLKNNSLILPSSPPPPHPQKKKKKPTKKHRASDLPDIVSNARVGIGSSYTRLPHTVRLEQHWIVFVYLFHFWIMMISFLRFHLIQIPLKITNTQNLCKNLSYTYNNRPAVS